MIETTKEIQERVENVPAEKKKKKKIWNIIFILFNIAVLALVVVNAFSEAGDVSLGEIFGNANGWYLLIGFGLIFVYIFADALAIFYLIRKTTGKFRFKLSVKTMLVGKYYDNVTPIASGGQPFQIYTLNKNNVPGAVASSIPLVKYFMFMVIYCLAALIVLLFGTGALNGMPDAARIVLISATGVGLILNFALPFVILLCSTIRPLGDAIVKFGLKTGKLFRIVKDYDKTYAKAQDMLNDYQRSIKSLAGNPLHLIILLGINLISYASMVVMPYFVMLGFTGGPFVAADFWQTTFMFIFCMTASSFFPAPGATGATELSFSAAFIALPFVMGSASIVSVGLLTWRLFSFYSFIIMGIGIIIYDQFRNKSKERKRLELETAKIQRMLAENTRKDFERQEHPVELEENTDVSEESDIPAVEEQEHIEPAEEIAEGGTETAENPEETPSDI